jgi:hypothetical protein
MAMNVALRVGFTSICDNGDLPGATEMQRQRMGVLCRTPGNATFDCCFPACGRIRPGEIAEVSCYFLSICRSIRLGSATL